MKPFKAFIILALMCNVLTTKPDLTQAAERQMNLTPPAGFTASKNGPGVAGPFDAFDTSSAPFSAPSPTSNWHIETVDSEKIAGEYNSLALDASNRPHISYHHYNWQGAPPALKYAWYDGATWQIETVDDHDSAGWHTSLALDGTGRPHISYSTGSHWIEGASDLRYARFDGSNWYTDTVDNMGSHASGGGQSSLALDSLGRPHISYYRYAWEGAPPALMHAWYDGASWQIETVDDGSGETWHVSLALDGADHPHISYSTGNSTEGARDLQYAWFDGTDWYTETVDGGGIRYNSLALDDSGRPRISYQLYNGESAVAELKYAWHDGAAWHIETIEREEQIGYLSLELDGADRPHIAYYDCGSVSGLGCIVSDLKYASLVSGQDGMAHRDGRQRGNCGPVQFPGVG